MTMPVDLWRREMWLSARGLDRHETTEDHDKLAKLASGHRFGRSQVAILAFFQFLAISRILSVPCLPSSPGKM